MLKRRKAQKRAAVRGRPFPAEWTRILERNVPLYKLLPAADRLELTGHIHVFLDEKRIDGCDGFDVTDDVRVTIAAHACLLLLHRETEYFPTTKSIFVYPTSFLVDVSETEDDWVVSERTEDRAGESWAIGPVVLSWDDVLDGLSEDAAGYNVLIHEFAHQLDLENGESDGVPKLESREAYEEWARIFRRAYESVVADADAGRATDIDAYGAESPAEFFAVAVESFFETPRDFEDDFPDVYRALAEYFSQDPARWAADSRREDLQ